MNKTMHATTAQNAEPLPQYLNNTLAFFIRQPKSPAQTTSTSTATNAPQPAPVVTLAEFQQHMNNCNNNVTVREVDYRYDKPMATNIVKQLNSQSYIEFAESMGEVLGEETRDKKNHISKSYYLAGMLMLKAIAAGKQQNINLEKERQSIIKHATLLFQGGKQYSDRTYAQILGNYVIHIYKSIFEDPANNNGTNDLKKQELIQALNVTAKGNVSLITYITDSSMSNKITAAMKAFPTQASSSSSSSPAMPPLSSSSTTWNQPVTSGNNNSGIEKNVFLQKDENPGNGNDCSIL